MDEEKRSAVALSYLTGVGAVRARRLVAHAGGFAGAFHLDDADYRELRIPDAAVREIRTGAAQRRADTELEFVRRHRIAVYDCLDEGYPARLRELPDAPLVVYYRGSVALEAHRTVAIVGTRTPSPAGLAFCEQLVEELRPYGVTVVSGLAYGIDVTAHRHALHTATPTFGVLAHGLNQIYPAAHRRVAQEIIGAGGLLTEFPSGMPSRREFFPMRNRIIAGISDAVVVVESAHRGGSMITADLAAGYGTPVFAVPGRPGDERSVGCNLLLKNHRAHLLDGAADLGYVLGWDQPAAARSGVAQGAIPFAEVSVDPQERSVLEQLRRRGPVDLDELAVHLALDSGALAAALLGLEFKGLVKSLPGKRYARA